jgi:ribosome-associated heat shock protein Hsp15
MEVRIDKWLWATRVFKTRNQATENCKAGKVKINGTAVKPSHIVKENEIFDIRFEQITRTFLVKGIIDKRVSAKLAVDYIEDITPKEIIEQYKLARIHNFEKRETGSGRPTKRDRRTIEKFKYL